MVGNVTMFPGKMHFFRPCWGDSTLEPNNTGNHKKWREPPKMVILSGKHIGAKHHWEPNNSKNHEKGNPQNIDFEWKTHWNQTTMETIKSEENHPNCWFWKENTFEQKALKSQTPLGTITSKWNHPKCWFWVENTLEPNYTGNHNKLWEPSKMFDFEQEALWSQTTLGTTTSEGNHPIAMIGKKVLFPIWDNGWVQTNVSQSEGRYEAWTNPEGQISATIPGFPKPGILDLCEVYQYADLFVFSFTVHLYTWKILRA